MKAVIYGRYSSDRQTEDSISAQRRACTDYAVGKGLEIMGEYTDEAVSGKGSKTAQRASYQRMLRDADRGVFDVILIHKYDRIARSLAEHVRLEERLNKAGVRLIAVAQDFGQGNEAMIVRTIVQTLSEYYILNLADEVKKGHKETALKALHNGGVAPFGYDVVDQKYIINELEAGFVKKIFDAAVHRQGFVEVIAEMADCGIKGKRGRPIKYTQIYEMLHNEKYTGVYVYCPQETPGREGRRTKPNAIRIENALPTIIDRAQFDAVQNIMAERRQTGMKSDYLCSGLVYCSCGAKMHGTQSSRNGRKYAYYFCSEKCGKPNVTAEAVDDAAITYLKKLLRPENEKKITAALQTYTSDDNLRIDCFNAALDAQVNDKQKQYDNLMSNMASGALPAEVLADMGERMKILKDEIAALRAIEPPTDYTESQIISWLESLKAAQDEKAIKLLIQRMEVKNKTEFNIQSTLNSVLVEDWLRIYAASFPQILFSYRMTFRDN